MSALRLASRRVALGVAAVKLEAICFTLVTALALGAAVVAFRAPAEIPPSEAVTVQLAPAEAKALIEATSGEAAAEIEANGDPARLINASLPFSSAPVQVARPFQLTGGERDHDRALLCLTQAVYYEAGYEPIAGRRAVAQVVLNRMRHPAFPKSVCGVVYQGARAPVCQFSFVCDGSLHRAPSPSAWREAREVAEAALAGFVEKSVGSATHYHADYVAPRWAPMLTKISKIGAHIFYRWPGAWGQRGAFTGRYAGEPQDPLGLRPPAPGEDETAAEEVLAIAPAEAGPPVARAPNDVGGLLDVSKGWKPSIPGPDEISGATTQALASQQAAPAPAAAVAATAAPIVASR